MVLFLRKIIGTIGYYPSFHVGKVQISRGGFTQVLMFSKDIAQPALKDMIFYPIPGKTTIIRESY